VPEDLLNLGGFMGIVRHTGLLVISSFLIFGCGGSQDNSSGGSILVEVSKGNPTSRPIYVWFDSTNTNPGTAVKITVARTSDLSKIVWGIVSNQPTQESITSPWTQGDVSANVSTISVLEVDLTPGVTYRITVFKADNTSGFVEYTVP
jgi:hypothetical protein